MPNNSEKRTQIIPQDSLPPIDLYMDQLLQYLSERLDFEARDRALTKTMINNYSKAGLIPPSVNKKYCREQLLLLIIIYHMKPVLSIDEISRISGAISGTAGVLRAYEDFYELQGLLADNSNATQKDYSGNEQELLREIFRLTLEAGQMKTQAEALIALLPADKPSKKKSEAAKRQ